MADAWSPLKDRFYLKGEVRGYTWLHASAGPGYY